MDYLRIYYALLSKYFLCHLSFLFHGYLHILFARELYLRIATTRVSSGNFGILR